jgi:hypothetical protein
MTFNVYDMLGAMNASGGISKASKFFVEITPPFSFGVDYNIFFLCEAAVLPGVALGTEEIRMAGYGAVEKRPNNLAFQDMPLTFFNDSNGQVLSFFHQWMQSVYNFNGSTNPAGTARNLAAGTFAYPKEYYGTVSITHFDDSGSEIITYTLYEAYPIVVGDIQVDWGLTDQLVRVPITFAYTYWETQTLDPGFISYRSEAIYNAAQSVAARVDISNKLEWEILNFTDPVILKNKVNLYAGVLSFL